MIDINLLLNTCYINAQTAQSATRVLAGYSHVIPIVLSISLALLIAFKAKFNSFSKVFLVFVLSFCLWLMGDLITWLSNDYHLIYASWATLVYIEIIFFLLGLYFILVFVHERDPKWYIKLLFVAVLIFPFIVTTSGQSVIGFDQSWCEAYNNTFLDNYKLVIESIIGLIILAYMIRSFIIKQIAEHRKADLIVLGSILLFFSIFGINQYIDVCTASL